MKTVQVYIKRKVIYQAISIKKSQNIKMYNCRVISGETSMNVKMNPIYIKYEKMTNITKLRQPESDRHRIRHRSMEF